MSDKLPGDMRALYESLGNLVDGEKAVLGSGSALAVGCFFDETRTSSLMRVVASTTVPGIAADLGAGTGVLGFTASLAGARHVDLVEQDRGLCAFLHAAASQLGYLRKSDILYEKGGRTIGIHRADARSFVPQRPLDMVLCEMVDDAGLSHELIVPVCQRVRAHAAPGARFYPESAELSMRLYNPDISRWPKYVCPPTPYASVQFATEEREGVDATVRVALEGGSRPVWGTIITTLAFPGGERLSRFPTLCNTYDVLVDTPLSLRWPFSRHKPGEHLFRIAYRFGTSGQKIRLRYCGEATAAPAPSAIGQALTR